MSAKAEQKGWVAGVGYALAEMLRNNASPDAAQRTMEAAGLTLASFKRAGVDPFDLKDLRLAAPPKRDDADPIVRVAKARLRHETRRNRNTMKRTP